MTTNGNDINEQNVGEWLSGYIDGELTVDLVVKNGWSLALLTREKPSLEDVFRNLTLEASRQAGDA